MDKVGVGIIGSRFAADLHAHALEGLRGDAVDLVAVCSRTRENAEAFAKRFRVPHVYTDYRQMLERNDIHVVDLCLTTDLHHIVAVHAAQARKHIICEKPLTGFFGQGEGAVGDTVSRQVMLKGALENASSVLKAVKDNGVRFCYAENFVYAPPLTKLKNLMKACQGTVLDIRAEESHSGSHADYSRQWRTSGGGALLRLGSHPVGAVLHLKHFEGLMKFNRPIRAKSVVADVGRLTKMKAFQGELRKWMVDSWVDVEDWSAVLITFEDGSKATIHASDVSLGGVKNLLSVYMSNAAAFVNINPNNGLVVYSPEDSVFGSEYITEKVETKAGWQFPSPDEDWMRGYPHEMVDFVNAIKEGRDPVSGLDLAYEVVEVIYSAYLAAESGRRVELAGP